MVQMKAAKDVIYHADTTNFISHMVQMKVGENKKEKFHTKLYIPHGSDES